jgi:hypothetical protein
MPGAYLRRNVRSPGEGHRVDRRLAAPGLALVASVASLAGAGGFGSLVLLAAIVVGAARLLDAVGSAVDARGGRFPIVTSVAGLACLVAAGAAHAPLLALGLVVCVGLELVDEAGARSDLAAEPPELAEAPMSRAA